MLASQVQKVVDNLNANVGIKKPAPDVGGKFRGKKSIQEALEKELTGQESGLVLHGAVLDHEQQPGQPCEKDLDRDVVIALGINYGQLATYAPGSTKTGMRPGLAALNSWFPKAVPSNYHLVAWNLAPVCASPDISDTR